MKLLQNIKFNRQHIILFALLALVVYVAIATLNVIARNYQLQQQIDILTNENALLELQNQQLRYEITYYQTDAFVEKAARSKLNLQAPGENVVVFPEHVPGLAPIPKPEPEMSLDQAIVSNFKQWMFFLFRIDL